MIKTKIGGTIIVLFIILIYYNNVPKDISKEDIVYCNKLTGIDLSKVSLKDSSFDSQMRLIHDIQFRIIKYSKHEQIPFGEMREPKQYYEQKRGYCFDRSRVIEKSLNIVGFQTRHVSVFRNIDSTPTHYFNLIQFLNSHAFTEVKTSKGWMYVGSNFCFIGLDTTLKPYGYKQLKLLKMDTLSWKYYNKPIVQTFVNRNSIQVYGLYSRNGMMYPPFILLPEINFNEFLYNFKELF